MQVELKFCLGNKVYFAYSQYISKCRISIWITSNAKKIHTDMLHVCASIIVCAILQTHSIYPSEVHKPIITLRCDCYIL